ncbi:MAG: hypothetical protein II187_10335 [Treponema sp.]|jgi:hypothetical protein|nr:hypothetical protein [Treponema sp.]
MQGRKTCIGVACAAALFLGTFSGCGLDSSSKASPASSTGHSVDATTSDPTQLYFSFRTSSDPITGTDVYYKIYSDSATLRAHRAVVENIGDSVESSFTKITNDYGYRKLALKEGASNPMIHGSNCYVYIRLCDYNTENSADYRNAVQAGASAMTRYDASVFLGSPRRYTGSNGFDFGIAADSGAYCRSPIPSSGDADFEGTPTSTGPWYVALYAVSVTTDTATATTTHSLHYCGSMTINKY